jgi:dihydroorotase
MNLLIKHGMIVDPSQKLHSIGDLWISEGKIFKISKKIDASINPGDTVIDATGCIVAPGFIDMHTHLREPGHEYKETIATGGKAAAAGGFTSIVCMANTKPVNDNPFVTQSIRMKAEREAPVNIYPVGALSKGLEGEALSEIGALRDAGCVAISDDGRPVMNSHLMRKALEYCKAFGLTVISHAEDLNLVGRGVIHEGIQSTVLGLSGIPSQAEEILVARDIALSELTQSPVHFAHISTDAAVRLIEDAKRRSIPVTAEVTPHHLFLTDENLSTYDSNFKMSPPLRTKYDIQALRSALKQNIIDAFATDHAPHSVLEKEIEFEEASFGVIGLETALPITFQLVEQKVLTLPQFIEKWTLGPASILKLKKGTLKAGADADITIFDPKARFKIDKETFQSKSRNTPFHGMKGRGKVRYTIVRGKVVYAD